MVENIENPANIYSIEYALHRSHGMMCTVMTRLGLRWGNKRFDYGLQYIPMVYAEENATFRAVAVEKWCWTGPPAEK